MPYTTQSDLDDAAGGAARFIELADFDGDGAPDVAMVLRAQAAADGVIDAHLRKFSAGDLAALRTAPTPTIKREAADQTIFELRKHRRQIGEDDWKDQESRMKRLQAYSADELRLADTKTPRARFVENCGEVTKKNTGGMW